MDYGWYGKCFRIGRNSRRDITHKNQECSYGLCEGGVQHLHHVLDVIHEVVGAREILDGVRREWLGGGEVVAAIRDANRGGVVDVSPVSPGHRDLVDRLVHVSLSRLYPGYEDGQRVPRLDGEPDDGAEVIAAVPL